MTAPKVRLAHSARITQHLVGNAVLDVKEARDGALALGLLLSALPKGTTQKDEATAHADAVEYVARKVIGDVLQAADRLEQTDRMLFKGGSRSFSPEHRQ